MLRFDVTDTIRFFDTLSISMRAKVSSGINKALLDLDSDVKRRSPVDKGDFRSSWQIDDASIELLKGSVFNNTIYGEVLELGSEKGRPPWRKAGARTKEENGRIWSSQAIGGIMNLILTDDYVNNISDIIANEILSEI